ncbi:HipA family kinase [Halomonas sp. AOP22-C1-8]|uniref:HipA family kinase n=1 Tax=Halomonas sp. AOP22-C1-8 TaxID=3457717 RepID=UPI0040344BD6
MALGEVIIKMPSVVDAKEILRQSTQGRTKPFIVRDTQNDQYVVKGVRGVGPPSLVSELICSELARRCELPVAEYSLMRFPTGMLDFSLEPSVSDLAGGMAFASKVAPHSQDLLFSQIGEIDALIQQRLLLFDIWVHNEDRCLSKQGGNVNLLWSLEKGLVVIDHNLAFDPLDRSGDFENHVFTHQRESFVDLEVRARHEEALDAALDDWDMIIGSIPLEWLYRDIDDETTEIHPTLSERFHLLARIRDPSFWSLI